MPEPFIVTTAIDYTNAAPHIGHAYEKVLADVLARYHRLKGDEVFFLTGVDQHGQKVQQSAEREGVQPQQFVDAITEKFRALWVKLDVRYDEWAATTDDRHKECVRKILARLNDEGQIYKAKRAGYYSVRQEQFLTDKERNEQGEYGPEWGDVEFREEENYYFKLAEHREWLLDFIRKRSAHNRPYVLPDFRVAELTNAVAKLDGDLCISRPKSRLSWGIEFPFDPDFVTYVWFDALVNYLSFAGYDPGRPTLDSEPPAFRWPALHVIGKDILIPAHGIYWPIMLKALGFAEANMPTLLVHGWWNVRGKTGESEKMSKSLGNVVDPNLLADKYGTEAVRYYLMSDIATGRDADFSEERLVQRYNAELANSLGNLLNRTLSMAAKYRDTRGIVNQEFLIKRPDDPLAGIVASFPGRKASLGDRYAEILEKHQVSIALEHSWEVVTACNALIDAAKPWTLAKLEKGGDDDSRRNLDAVLYHLAESLRIIAILVSPVLPRAAAGIFEQLNWNGPMALAEAEWGKLPDGHVVGKPTPLFPRIEAERPSPH